jgi:hypothetical protein
MMVEDGDASATQASGRFDPAFHCHSESGVQTKAQTGSGLLAQRQDCENELDPGCDMPHKHCTDEWVRNPECIALILPAVPAARAGA